MEHHQWIPIDGDVLTMKCIHCEEVIDVKNTEIWNMEIFSHCPKR